MSVFITGAGGAWSPLGCAGGGMEDIVWKPSWVFHLLLAQVVPDLSVSLAGGGVSWIGVHSVLA